MPRYELTGPGGEKFELEAPDEAAALSAFGQFNAGGAPTEPTKPAAPPAYDRNDRRFQDGSFGSALRGVPILGAGVNRAGAAISAAAQPLTGAGSPGATFGERYGKNLEQENAAEKDFQQEHPILDAVSGAVGGTLALGGVAGASAKAANALGMVGRTLPAMKNAALSGAAIGAVDSAARGGDASEGGAMGAVTGAGGVLAGKLIGKGIDAAGRVVRGAEPPVPTRTLDVNGTPVPVSESAITRDPATAAREQIMLRGGAGDPAQAVATEARDQSLAALRSAEERFAAGLDPEGRIPASTPEAAAQTVASDLVSAERQRAAAEVQRIRGVDDQQQALKAGMDAPGATPAPDAPYPAAQTVSEALQAGYGTARTARTAAYDRLGGFDGEFSPAMFRGAPNAIRDNLTNAADPVRVSQRLTPNAADALDVIDQRLGAPRFENLAQRGDMIPGPDGRPAPRPITAQDVESVRKELVQLRRAANQAARAQGGSAEDARAVGRIMDEFDSHIRRGVDAGGFSGDGPAYLRAGAEARRLHSELRQNYSAQGPGDKVGRAIEDILGRYPGQEATPDKIVQMLFGNANEIGGANTVQLAQRLRGMFGEQSPQWAAVRKAAIAHMTEAPAGMEAISHTKQADRILNFLNGNKGRMLSNVLFSPSERANLATYAQRVRSARDPDPANSVERLIAKLSGRDGSPPSSTTEVVNQLFDLRANKETSVQLARELQSRLAPESFAQVKQGMWSRLTEAPEGMVKWESQRVSQNLHNFLKSELAKTIYTPNERMLMKTIADAHSKMIPVAGSTNPSGTAPMLARIAKGAQNQLLGLFGFAHGGLPGAGVALAGGRALQWIGNRRAAKEATELFLGPQKRVAGPRNVSAQRAAALAAQSTPALRNQSSQ